MSERVAGPISIKIDGKVMNGKGDFTYSGQKSVASGVSRSDHEVVGYREEPKIPFIEGVITDTGDLDVAAMQNERNIEAVSLELANDKTFVLSQANFAGESDQTTGEGEIPVRWEGKNGEEV